MQYLQSIDWTRLEEYKIDKLWSQNVPTPLVWSPAAGHSGESLDNISAEEYPIDMCYYKLGKHMYLICGYYLEPSSWSLFPVFAPGETPSGTDLIIYGQHFRRGTYFKAHWASELRDRYRVSTEQNTVYQKWSAVYEPKSEYTLPATVYTNLKEHEYYPFAPKSFSEARYGNYVYRVVGYWNLNGKVLPVLLIPRRKSFPHTDAVYNAYYDATKGETTCMVAEEIEHTRCFRTYMTTFGVPPEPWID